MEIIIGAVVITTTITIRMQVVEEDLLIMVA
jgi:hypothetical protein